MLAAITTAPRTPPTLNRCVSSMIQAGWTPDQIHVFSEPGVIPLNDVVWHQNEKKLGCFHNWVQSARWLVENGPDVVMTVQDDAIFHPESKEFVESVLWPGEDCGFLSLYTAKHYSERNPVGINRINIKSLWGVLALVWKKEVLKKVLDTKIIKEWRGVSNREVEQSEVKHVDSAIGLAINYLGLGMYFIDPSPVTHGAVTSSIGHGTNRGRRNCSRPAVLEIPLKDQVFPKVEPFVFKSGELKGTNACYYLGDVIRFDKDYFKGGLAPVFQCLMFGECVLKRIDKTDKKRCIACSHYRPTGKKVVLGKNSSIDSL